MEEAGSALAVNTPSLNLGSPSLTQEAPEVGESSLVDTQGLARGSIPRDPKLSVSD